MVENKILTKPEVQAELDRFVKVRLYTDRQTADNIRNRDFQLKRFGTAALPLYVFLTPEGREITRLPKAGLPGAQDFLTAFKRTLEETTGAAPARPDGAND